MHQESLGRSKRIRIKKRQSLTPRPALKKRKRLNTQKKDTGKDLRSIVDRIEDDEIMKALQDDDTRDSGIEQTGPAYQDDLEENFDILKDKESQLDQDVDHSQELTGVEQTVSINQDDKSKGKGRRIVQRFRLDYETERRREIDKKQEERREVFEKFKLNQDQKAERKKKRTEKQKEREEVSDSENDAILEPETDDDSLVTRKYLEGELGALGRVIVEKITEELNEKIPSPLQDRSETIRATGTIPEVNQHGLEHDDQIIIEGIPVNSHCWFLAANAKTMRKRANHIMRGYWKEDERNILVLRRNKLYADGRVVKSKELNNIKQLCLNLQSAKHLKYKKRKHNIDANLREWLKDFLKNDRYRRSRPVYDDND